MKKILIFSDNHGDVDIMFQIKEQENSDLVLHAGDFCCEDIVIEAVADYLVCGNNDFFGENQKTVNVDAKKIMLVHGHEYMTEDNEIDEDKLVKEAKKQHCQIVIFGHTHLPLVKWKNEILLINPGSLKYNRDKEKSKSYAIALINENDVKAEIKYI